MLTERITGTVTQYDAAAGQGVIVRDDDQSEVFVDVFGLAPGQEQELNVGMRVEFRVLGHTTGLRAEDVIIFDDRESSKDVG